MEDKQFKQLDKDIKDVRKDFNHHIEVYAENGKELAGLKSEVGGMNKRIDDIKKDIKEDINEVKKLLGNNYVTVKEFLPVRLVVYGLVGILLAGIVGALVSSVISNRQAEQQTQNINKQIVSGFQQVLPQFQVEVEE
jgi:gas vesicle protein